MGNDNFRPIRPPTEATIHLKVEDLWDSVAHTWNDRSLKDNFLDTDVRKIQAINLGHLREEDIIVWHFESHDVYMV